MVNLLILNKDIYEIKRMFNSIISENENIRLAKIVTSQNEGIEALNTDKIDVAIINFDSLKNESMNLFDCIDKNKYKNSIIIQTKNFKEIQSILENKIVFDYIIDGSNKNEIMFKLNKMITNKDLEEKRRSIIKELKYIGYNVEHIGTSYLIETIFQLYKNKKLMVENLKRDVYPLVSKIYNKEVHNIKCNITRATDWMYYGCDNHKLKEYFGFDEDIKPTAKIVALTVLSKIS